MIQIVAFIISLIITSTCFSFGETGSELTSKNLKTILCNQLVQSEYGINRIDKNICLKSLFNFYQKPVRKTFTDSTLTTKVFVAFSLYGVNYKSSLKALLKVSDSTGSVKRNGWELIKITEDSYEDEYYLRQAWRNEDYLETNADLLSIGLNQLLLNSIWQAHNDRRSDIKSYYDIKADQLLDKETQYHIIRNPNTEVIVGFIIESGYTNKNLEINVTYKIKLDAEGKIFDEDVEYD